MSEANNGTSYESLADALSVANYILKPEQKKGGMTIKYVQTSDNNYVQYRLMKQTFSTDEADWQGVDDEPTSGSDNIVKSDGVWNFVSGTALQNYVDCIEIGGIIGATGVEEPNNYRCRFKSFIPPTVHTIICRDNLSALLYAYTEDGTYIGLWDVSETWKSSNFNAYFQTKVNLDDYRENYPNYVFRVVFKKVINNNAQIISVTDFRSIYFNDSCQNYINNPFSFSSRGGISIMGLDNNENGVRTDKYITFGADCEVVFNNIPNCTISVYKYNDNGYVGACPSSNPCMFVARSGYKYRFAIYPTDSNNVSIKDAWNVKTNTYPLSKKEIEKEVNTTWERGGINKSDGTLNIDPSCIRTTDYIALSNYANDTCDYVSIRSIDSGYFKMAVRTFAKIDNTYTYLSELASDSLTECTILPKNLFIKLIFLGNNNLLANDVNVYVDFNSIFISPYNNKVLKEVHDDLDELHNLIGEKHESEYLSNYLEDIEYAKSINNSTEDQTWISSNGYMSALIDVRQIVNMTTISVKKNSNGNRIIMAFLKQGYESNNPVYATGYNGCIRSDVDIEDLSIPSDTNYIYFYVRSNDTYYVPQKVVVKNNDNAIHELQVDVIELQEKTKDIPKILEYTGDYINIKTKGFIVNAIKSINGMYSQQQGMAIYGKYAFVSPHSADNIVQVIDLEQNTVIQTITCPTSGLSSHMNAMCFGNEKVSIDRPFPLMYISQWNGARKLFVYDITETDGVFSSNLVQTITPSVSSSIFGSGTNQWVVDTDNNTLYSIAIDYTTKSVITKFALPKLEDGSAITLTDSDVLDSFDIEPILEINDMFYNDGKIYVVNGTSEVSADEHMIRVISLNSKDIISKIPLSYYASDDIYFTPEGMDIYNGKIVFTVYNRTYLYCVDFATN